jgi:hypothetical protein
MHGVANPESSMGTRHRNTNYLRLFIGGITVASGADFDEALSEPPDLTPALTVAVSSAPATYISSVAFRF